ncbi:MAG: hypothetical protein ACPGPI_03375 [Longimicrobiales bacterium]
MALPPEEGVAQEPFLRGTAFLGDTVMSRGVVVLHHLTQGTQGELDSMRIRADGSFRFTLPRDPDPLLSEIFFASVRHDGVLYFGPMITTAAQLDSSYQVNVYDTLLAPSEGLPVPLQSRSVFIEPDSTDWRVTDLFELRNDQARTIVARSGGYTWRHPMPAGIREVEVGEGELAADAAQYLNGELVARAALPPGGRLFVVRYRIDSPFMSFPVQPGTERLDVLVREPAPTLAIDGLEFMERQEFEAGSTYRRFAGANLFQPAVTIVTTQEITPPRVELAAVLLALLLTAVGVSVLRPRAAPEDGPVTASNRHDLLVEIARLDEEFERSGTADAEQVAYQQRRTELLRRIRSLS